MAKDKTHAIKWLADVEDHDYPDAESYLRLIFDDKRVDRMMTELRNAAIVEFKAKDIFRATELSLLGVSKESSVALKISFALNSTMAAFRSSVIILSTRLSSKIDRKSTRLNSSHANISYAVF